MADENTPLLSNDDTSRDESFASRGKPLGSFLKFATPEIRILLAGFMITTSLCFTQVPIMYAFRKMECEDFYDHSPPYGGTADRCSRPEIDAGIAVQMTILGLSAIVCGVFNLLLTGMQIKRWGPHFSLVVNTFFPILRVTMQAVGVGIGARTGIILVQSSQVLSIVGGPAGYLLVLNTSIAEVVEPVARTGAFGKLQGSAMFGTALGYLLGGIVGEVSIIRRPFEVTAVLLTISCIYVFFFTPYIDPKTLGGTNTKTDPPSKKSSLFLGVLAPRVLRLQDGRLLTFYGAPLLALGTFVAGLAIGYAPILTQMYAITTLHFSPTGNSGFMFVTASVRGLFLMFAFPRIIARGRKWFASVEDAKQPEPTLVERIPTRPTDLDPIIGTLAEEEPVNPPAPVDEDTGAAFDLWFLRWSLVGDAAVTGCIGFATQSWHIYLAGFTLPFFSGSDATGKGILTEMVPPSQRADALQAISLVGYVAALTTVGVFGFVFSAFAAIGAAHLTFFCNAAVAVLAIAILLCCRLPPQGSSLVSDDEAEPSTIAETSVENGRGEAH
ncbi:hypothetical protein BJ170DRAFT_220909 [Xylariales sp. AK1849]|nr:hypothetical protein BJ170DRAFT_220909 [Xylariales sp. AK1849]